MLKKTLLILLVLLVPGVVAVAGTPAEPGAQTAELTPDPVVAADAAAGEPQEADLEPFQPVLEGLEGEVVFAGGGCGGAGHQDCIADCSTQTQECMDGCSTPMCYFQCRNQEALCVDICDNRYGCCC